LDVKETVSASAKLGSADALQLAREAAKVIVAKGKRVTVFDLQQDQPDDETLLKHLLGPTGNLRAPVIKQGKTLLVGFNEEEYAQALT